VRIDFLWLFGPRANVKNLAPFLQAGGDGVAFQPRLADEGVASRFDLLLRVWIISLRHLQIPTTPATAPDKDWGKRQTTHKTKSTCQNPVSKPRQQDCSAAAQAQYSKFLLA
jgi:hypothetical protein